MKKERQSTYELLRILAILLIVMMHGIRSAYSSTNLINEFSFNVVNTIGNMGVTTFMLISGFFGIKFKASKLILLWGTVLIYSILIGIATYIMHPITELKPLLKFIYETLTPVSSNTWWFMTSYIIIYCLSPFVNKLISVMTQRQLLMLIGTLSVFYILFPTFLLHSVSYTAGGKSTVNLLLIYFIGRYLALYGLPDFFRKHVAAIFTFCALVIFYIDMFVIGKFFMCKDHNLLIVVGAISLFTLFGRIQFTSAVVNKLAQFVFPLYLMNMFLLNELEFQYLGRIQDASYMPYYLLTQAEIVAIAFAVAWLLQPLCARLLGPLMRYADKHFQPMQL